MSGYICMVCNYMENHNEVPKKCPYCGVPSTNLKMLTQKEAEEIKAKQKMEKSMVDVTGDSIALRGYKPSGYSKNNMFA